MCLMCRAAPQKTVKAVPVRLEWSSECESDRGNDTLTCHTSAPSDESHLIELQSICALKELPLIVLTNS